MPSKLCVCGSLGVGCGEGANVQRERKGMISICLVSLYKTIHNVLLFEKNKNHVISRNSAKKYSKTMLQNVTRWSVRYNYGYLNVLSISVLIFFFYYKHSLIIRSELIRKKRRKFLSVGSFLHSSSQICDIRFLMSGHLVLLHTTACSWISAVAFLGLWNRPLHFFYLLKFKYWKKQLKPSF